MCGESARTGVPKELQRKDDGVLQNLNTALLVVDASARITSSNPPAEQILGESAAALADEPVSRWFAEGGGIDGAAGRVRRQSSTKPAASSNPAAPRSARAASASAPKSSHSACA